MTHTVDTLLSLADEYTRICTFMQDGTTAESAKKARETLRTALTEALGFRPDWADFANGRECGRLEIAKPVQEPLTDKQMWAIWNSQGDDAMEQTAAIAFARAIEKAHGIIALKELKMSKLINITKATASTLLGICAFMCALFIFLYNKALKSKYRKI